MEYHHLIYACDRSLQSLLSGKFVKRLTVTSVDPLFRGGDRFKDRLRDLRKCDTGKFPNHLLCCVYPRRWTIVRFKLVLIVAIVAMCVSALAVTVPTFDWTAKADEVPAAALMRDFSVDYPETHPLVEGVFDWEHYFTYEEAVYWCLKWAEDFPDLVDVYTVGESFLDIPIYQITITNKATGKDTDKPAMFVAGNRHAGEVTARTATMLFAYDLINGYGKDEEISYLVDNFTFYVRPTETLMEVSCILRHRTLSDQPSALWTTMATVSSTRTTDLI